MPSSGDDAMREMRLQQYTQLGVDDWVRSHGLWELVKVSLRVRVDSKSCSEFVSSVLRDSSRDNVVSFRGRNLPITLAVVEEVFKLPSSGYELTRGGARAAGEVCPYIKAEMRDSYDYKHKQCYMYADIDEPHASRLKFLSLFLGLRKITRGSGTNLAIMKGYELANSGRQVNWAGYFMQSIFYFIKRFGNTTAALCFPYLQALIDHHDPNRPSRPPADDREDDAFQRGSSQGKTSKRRRGAELRSSSEKRRRSDAGKNDNQPGASESSPVISPSVQDDDLVDAGRRREESPLPEEDEDQPWGRSSSPASKGKREDEEMKGRSEEVEEAAKQVSAEQTVLVSGAGKASNVAAEERKAEVEESQSITAKQRREESGRSRENFHNKSDDAAQVRSPVKPPVRPPFQRGSNREVRQREVLTDLSESQQNDGSIKFRGPATLEISGRARNSLSQGKCAAAAPDSAKASVCSRKEEAREEPGSGKESTSQKADMPRRRYSERDFSATERRISPARGREELESRRSAAKRDSERSIRREEEDLASQQKYARQPSKLKENSLVYKSAEAPPEGKRKRMEESEQQKRIEVHPSANLKECRKEALDKDLKEYMEKRRRDEAGFSGGRFQRSNQEWDEEGRGRFQRSNQEWDEEGRGRFQRSNQKWGEGGQRSNQRWDEERGGRFQRSNQKWDEEGGGRFQRSNQKIGCPGTKKEVE